MGITVRSLHDLLLLLSCRDADLLLIANKGGFAFAVDPDTGDRVWATAVGKASQSFQQHPLHAYICIKPFRPLCSSCFAQYL